MAFLDLSAELVGAVPGLSPQLADKHVNRALDSIYSAWRWSFLVTDGYLVCPAVLTDGSASITQYSASVTLNAAASAAVAPFIAGTSLPTLTNLQIRFGSSPAVGQIYNILAYDNSVPTAVVLTLDRIVLDATDASAAYQIYRCYVPPPVTDFLAWLSLTDYDNAIRIERGRLSLTSTDLDLRDPQRQSQGLAYFLASYLANQEVSAGSGTYTPNPNQGRAVPLYELWPHPTNGQAFYARFRRRGRLFTLQSDTQPAVISDALIIHKALGWYTYPWAQANQAHIPQLRGVNWAQLIQAERASYAEELRDAKRNDGETQEQNVWNRGHGLRTRLGNFKNVGPLIPDADYLQSHLVVF